LKKKGVVVGKAEKINFLMERTGPQAGQGKIDIVSLVELEKKQSPTDPI